MSGLELPKSPTSSTIVTPSTHKLLDAPDPRIGHTRIDDEADIEKTYIFGAQLGRGGFGVVLEVEHKATKIKYAMKIVQKDKPGSFNIQLLEREVEVLKRIVHPHIIRLEEVYETSKKMYMILELCRGGELSTELKKRHYFKEEDTKIIMKKIVEAVVFMHDCDMVHRDLKLENVLISTEDPTIEYNIKVTDFGLCYVKGLPGCEVSQMDNRCGTLLYMAPEVIRNRHDYTKMCDVWSLGVIMYCMLCGRYPYRSSSATKLEEMIFSGRLDFTGLEWDNVSEAAKTLITNMMCIETTDRYTARRILDDVWFTGERPKRFLNAMDLMRDMAIEQAREKMRENMQKEEENKAETDIIISCPSGSLEPSGTFTTSPEHVADDEEERTNSARKKTGKLPGTKSMDLKRPATQSSPIRKSTGKQHHSTSGLHSSNKSGSQATAMHSKSSHTSRQRFVSEGGSKNSLSPISSQRSRDRSYTATGYQTKKTSESLLSPAGSASSHTISGSSRRYSTSQVSGSRDTVSKKKQLASSSSLSPSTSPRVSPKGSPRPSPKTSPTVSPRSKSKKNNGKSAKE